ncbi:MAG TPA: hypothetical protein VM681_07145 [Candidatus Thermoplasmatota archaeon]|nr:hypothetical protein [Candidatus Thermoplasmatota archaeon]
MELPHVAWLAILGAGTVGLAALLLWWLLPSDARPRCAHCEAILRPDLPFCQGCAQKDPAPREGHPGAGSYGFPAPPPTIVERFELETDEGGATRNARVSRRALGAATLAMGAGLAVRAAALLGVGVTGSSFHAFEGAVTLVGGVVAFVGFVILDAA